MSLSQMPEKPLRLIGHVICNYPSAELCRSVLSVMQECGVALSEIQIPCSEPIADGPLFMKANHIALTKGVKVSDAFALCAYEPQLPKVIMTYANIIYKHGVASFCQRAAEQKVKALIVPDWPFELASELLQECKRTHIGLVPIVTPMMNEQRMQEILPHGGGFVYAVARSGVTGYKTTFANDLAVYIDRIRQHTDLPIAMGFGLSEPADIQQLKGKADFAIVGSAALRVLEEKGLAALRDFWQKMSQACH